MSDKVFKFEIGKEAYLELIEAVGEFDAEAAELLDSEIRRLSSFEPCNILGGAFSWKESKQGSEYWIKVQDKLKWAGYYG